MGNRRAVDDKIVGSSVHENGSGAHAPGVIGLRHNLTENGAAFCEVDDAEGTRAESVPIATFRKAVPDQDQFRRIDRRNGSLRSECCRSSHGFACQQREKSKAAQDERSASEQRQHP
jgi:hypothetical protein